MNAIYIIMKLLKSKIIKGRQILPPNLIVDEEFKIDGTSSKFPPELRYN